MTSLGEALSDTVARRGAAAALLYEGSAYSYGDLGGRAAAVAGGLAQRDVRAGDRVAVGLRNSPDLVAAVVGVLRAGAVLVPLNPAYTAAELLYALADSGARTAVLEPEQAGMVARERLADLREVVTSVADFGRTPCPPARVGADAPALIVYTSGTTGRPKGAVLSHRALLSNLTTVARVWRWTEDDRLLLALPCFHLHGLALGVLTSWLVGSSVILRPRFVADQACADLQCHRATMFFGVPTMYNRLLALPAAATTAHDLRHMRLWVSGSAPLPAATVERFRRRFGAELHDRYGMTECGFVLSTVTDGPRRAGTVGVPLPGISIRLVDPTAADGGRLSDVPAGADGEIAIAGPNLFSGYWNRPEDTRRVLIGGYLRSGDLARREADGLFRIVGRMSVDIIKTRGFKVSAVEIEDCLQRHPAVQEVAVVGVPDADQGERVAAAITPTPGSGVSADAIRAYARQHLAPHKVPSRIVFLDDIPRIGPGKFKKKELVRRLSIDASTV
ncbi:MAG: AMP-binding protein [Candidatus Binatia bacterium]